MANRESSHTSGPVDADAAPALPTVARRLQTSVANVMSNASALLVVLVLLIFFSLTSTYFFTAQNLLNIIKQMSIVGVLAIGMTLVILIGGIDLSVGSVVLLSGGVTAVLMANQGVPVAPAILAGLLAGALVGLVNGLLIEVAQISPVIATLGVMIAVRGLGQIIIDNSWVWVTQGFFVTIASRRLFFLPIMAAIMLALYAIFAVLLRQTRFGRYIYAIGGNPVAARLCALPIIRTKVLVYVLCGSLAGVGGMLTAAALGVVGPNVGTGLEFDAVTAVVLGGTRLGGGVGRVEKTLLGTAILAMVLNYLTLRGIPDIWQTTVTGFLLLGAVLLDRLFSRTRGS